MGWFHKAKKKPLVVPPKEELWVVCPSCQAHVFKQGWENSMRVCPRCNFHDRLSAQERIEITLDSGTFREFDTDINPSDPLTFADAQGTYAQKITEVQQKTGMSEAIITGTGKINGVPVAMGVMDFRFLGGSLGAGTGEKIVLLADHARRHKLPLIIFSASGGARMQEGIISLMQMAKTSAAIAKLHEARIPYISVLTNPTYGGVSASFATLGDLNIAEPGPLIGFAGRRVIEQTIKEQLPPDFQTAEYLLQHGFVDRIVSRPDLKNFLSSVLMYWRRK
ncbi:MAG: acetyl-CoA carboxylase, carboxyltransferase subunit beta [Kiritimatiellae bacterium]|nr:acetyl-CoA carboxylase, carboxyltransferase subunit beta [Kiritimatiellia bacterium]